MLVGTLVGKSFSLRPPPPCGFAGGRGGSPAAAACVVVLIEFSLWCVCVGIKERKKEGGAPDLELTF